MNQNFIATTKDWLKVSEAMQITAYYPVLVMEVEPEINEPGRPINLSAEDRARMDRAKPGAGAAPERL